MEHDERPGKGRLGELYRLHYVDALRLAYLISGDRRSAEDLVQEAFVRVAARFLDLRSPESFEAYLKRTVVNLCRKQFRRRKVERAYLEREARMATPPSTQPDVAGREALRLALLRLPQRQRAAIVLRFYEDLPERDIADALSCRPGTVKSLIARGMKALRAEMGVEADR